MKFNDYEWHNATLEKINIDRSNPGYKDTISIDIVWSDGTKSTFMFKKVYKAIMELDFGVDGIDLILEAYTAPDNDNDLVALKNMWKDYRIGNIDCYVFQTSARGKIKIMATSFNVLKPDK